MRLLRVIASVCIILTLAGCHHRLRAQAIAAYPMPNSHWQFFDSSGRVLAGGLLYTYAAGTSTPQATFTDSTALVQNANPVVLGADGAANIWFGLSNYKILLTDSAGNQIFSQDNVGIRQDVVYTGPIAHVSQTITGPISLGSGGVFYGLTAGLGTFNSLLTANNGLTVNTTGSGNNDSFNFSGTTSGDLVTINGAAGDSNTGTALRILAKGSEVPFSASGANGVCLAVYSSGVLVGNTLAPATLSCPLVAGYYSPPSGASTPVVNQLVKLQANSVGGAGLGPQVILATTADTTGSVVGICLNVQSGSVCNAATFNLAETVAYLGPSPCQFDATPVVVNDYVTVSSTVAANCHDFGANPPPPGTQILGKAITGGLASTVQYVWLNIGNGLAPWQAKRGVAGCATGAAIGGACTTVVTWPTAFADANYTAHCTGVGVASGVPVNGGLTAKIGASVTFQTVATTAAAAQYTNIECSAQHD